MYEGFVSQYIPKYEHTRWARQQYIEGFFEDNRPVYGIRAFLRELIEWCFNETQSR